MHLARTYSFRHYISAVNLDDSTKSQRPNSIFFDFGIKNRLNIELNAHQVIKFQTNNIFL